MVELMNLDGTANQSNWLESASCDALLQVKFVIKVQMFLY